MIRCTNCLHEPLAYMVDFVTSLHVVVAGAREGQLKREDENEYDPSQQHETSNYPRSIDDRGFPYKFWVNYF